MRLTSPTMSNAERQRRFQKRHPGYDRRRKAHQRAMARRDADRLLAARLAAAATDPAQTQPAPLSIPSIFTPMPLALPAPVVDPWIAELNELQRRAERGQLSGNSSQLSAVSYQPEKDRTYPVRPADR